jgi:hypothetical protein
MPVPWSIVAARRLRRFGLQIALCMATVPLLAGGPVPPSLRLPLDPLGFQTLSPQFLAAGSSMLTLHFVDDQHLLLTFNSRRLLKRIPGDPDDDADRTIDALLIELPSGHVLGRTIWRVHDRAQYLWPLGQGHFLLRVRNSLTTFAPMANLASGDPFHERPFLNPDRQLEMILLSPEADLLTVETIKQRPPAPKRQTPLFGPTPPPQPPPPSDDPAPVQIGFYRLSVPTAISDEVKVRVAGVVRTAASGGIAITGSGFLSIVDQGRQHWAFDFHSHNGSSKELAPFDSACRPVPFFVSNSEFIAFGCRNGNSRQAIGGFNMRGEEMWEQGLYGDYISPSLVFAPSTGRFALGRVLVRTPSQGTGTLVPEQVGTQTVVVYQTGTGKQVFHVECSPTQLAGQNFALSPNGMSIAVVHDGAIEVYGLPSLTTQEQTAVAQAHGLEPEPEPNDAPIRFSAQSAPSATATAEPASESIVPATPSDPSSAQAPAPSQLSSSDSPTPTNAVGDPPPEEHRKPPTLYTLPTDPQAEGQREPR